MFVNYSKRQITVFVIISNLKSWTKILIKGIIENIGRIKIIDFEVESKKNPICDHHGDLTSKPARPLTEYFGIPVSPSPLLMSISISHEWHLTQPV